MKEREWRRRRRDLTVCIAATSVDGSIFCAADRMVTVGDIEMESPVPKMHMITTSIIVMPSDDDAALHTEILSAATGAVSHQIGAAPTKWMPVSLVVSLYIKAFNDVKAKMAEQVFLSPLGLTQQSFLLHMATMEKSLVTRISEDLINYKLPAMSVIIAGLDSSGSHIYEVHNGESGCFNTIGYAAIGAGARHARAHFMVSNQSHNTSIAESLWATYLAKKRAEVAPGVGETTDIAMLGPQLGRNVLLATPVTTQLEAVYKKTVRAEEKARQTAAKTMVEYVEKLGQRASQVTAQAVPPEATPKEEAADTDGAGQPVED
jgi:hypothetical protein